METTNKRNQFGVKHMEDCYLNIKGKRYEQWSDHESLEDMQKEFPQYEFIKRKQPDGFTRIYRLVD